MKVIDINLKVTGEQMRDIKQADKVYLRVNIRGEIGDTIALYPLKSVLAEIDR